METRLETSSRAAVFSRLQYRLSTSQEEILHLWPVVTIQKSRNQAVRVVQKTSDETVIIPQRLRNSSGSNKRNDVVKSEGGKTWERQFIRERSRCRYNLRTSVINTYTDVDWHHHGLYSEEATYCRQCQKHFFGICSIHFKLVLNREVARDGSVDERARLTAPWPLYISKSKIEGAGEGVWTSAALPKGLVFGPYEGQVLKLKRNSREVDSGYAWHLKSSRRSVKVYIDSVNKSISNWLRYVNCARNSAEMNLEAFQYKRDVYYITLHDIERNTELLVWYGDEYGKELGISSLSNSVLSIVPAQGFTQHSEQSAEEPVKEKHEFSEAVAGSKKVSIQHRRLNIQHRKHTAGSKRNKVALSKPQSALQLSFLPARLDPGENHTVKIVYISSTKNDEHDAVREHVISGAKTPSQLPSVRFSQKYNCKYNYAYCVECKKTNRSLCPKHPMTLILDNIVARDGSFPDRALLTAPWPLYIAKSKVEDAGQGVWTSATLPQGLVFGPCEGHIIKRIGGVSGFGWEIRGRPDIEIDAQDTSISNWVRYINCARNYIERNLIAMQIQDEIFYVTNTEIERGTELMVWYGAAYGNWLGISTKDFFKPQLNEKELERWCSECQVLFTSPEYLSKHQARCRQGIRGKTRKRKLQDTEISQNDLRTEQRKRKNVTKLTEGPELEKTGLKEAEYSHNQTVDLDCNRFSSDAEIIDNLSPSDHTRTKSCISAQSLCATKSTMDSGNCSTVPDRLISKAGGNSWSGSKVFHSHPSQEEVQHQTLSHNGDSAHMTVHEDVSHVTAENINSSLHKDIHKLSSHHEGELTEDFPCSSKKLTQDDALDQYGLLDVTPTSGDHTLDSLLSPHTNQSPGLGKKKLPADFCSSHLDSFLDHTKHFNDSFILEDSLSCSPEQSNGFDKSKVSDMSSYDKLTDHSGYGILTNPSSTSNPIIDNNIYHNHCGGNTRNAFDPSCLIDPIYRAGHSYLLPCRNVNMGNLDNDIDRNIVLDHNKTNYLPVISDSFVPHSFQRLHHSRQPLNKNQRGTYFIEKEARQQKGCVLQKGCHRNGGFNQVANLMPQRTPKKWEHTENSLEVCLKTRQILGSEWKSRNSHAENHGRSQHSRKKLSGHRILHESMTKMGNYQPGQIEQSCHRDVLKQGQRGKSQSVCGAEKSTRRGNYSIHEENERSFPGFRQPNNSGTRRPCAKTQPFKVPHKSGMPCMKFELYSPSNNGTLYECYRCCRKYTSKYNLHEHQFFCK